MASKKIQLIIRDAGLGSRRAVDEMIREGRVTLNGRIVDDPAATADPEKDHIKVDGKLLHPSYAPKQYYLFHKPRNVVSTLSDPQGRVCVGDLIKSLRKGLFTVGRLDFDAEGLMILTNDGTLAERLTHPSHRVSRTYNVKVQGHPSPKALARIKPGMSIGEGDRLGNVEFRVTEPLKGSTWIRIVLYEGKKNEIKRIFKTIRHPVRRIRRIGFGPLYLGRLPVGQWRRLTLDELDRLRATVASKAPRKPPTGEKKHRLPVRPSKKS
jgi:23S rRNA pseudouridine2605 synthase